jgi:hypothetical protein
MPAPRSRIVASDSAGAPVAVPVTAAIPVSACTSLSHSSSDLAVSCASAVMSQMIVSGPAAAAASSRPSGRSLDVMITSAAATAWLSRAASSASPGRITMLRLPAQDKARFLNLPSCAPAGSATITVAPAPASNAPHAATPSRCPSSRTTMPSNGNCGPLWTIEADSTGQNRFYWTK